MRQEILSEAVRLASEHDREWTRRRVLHTLLVVLFVFRLVFAPEPPGLRGDHGGTVGGVPPLGPRTAAPDAGLGVVDVRRPGRAPPSPSTVRS